MPDVSITQSPASASGESFLDACESFLPMRQTLLQETRQVILKVPPPYREAVILNHIGGFSYREMAKILAVPTGTVMSRLFRGRRTLRTSLGAHQSSVESAH